MLRSILLNVSVDYTLETNSKHFYCASFLLYLCCCYLLYLEGTTDAGLSMRRVHVRRGETVGAVMMLRTVAAALFVVAAVASQSVAQPRTSETVEACVKQARLQNELVWRLEPSLRAAINGNRRRLVEICEAFSESPPAKSAELLDQCSAEARRGLRVVQRGRNRHADDLERMQATCRELTH